MTDRLDAALALLGPDLARHVANALAGYRRAYLHDGQAPPPDVTRLIHAAKKVAARSGQLATSGGGTADDDLVIAFALSYRQAATVAGVSERTIRRRVRAGALPAHRLGRRVLIAAPDLFQHLEEVA